MLAGLGFFYGNFTQIGTFVDSTGQPCNFHLLCIIHSNTDLSSNYTFTCNNVNCVFPRPYAFLQQVYLYLFRFVLIPHFLFPQMD